MGGLCNPYTNLVGNRCNNIATVIDGFIDGVIMANCPGLLLGAGGEKYGICQVNQADDYLCIPATGRTWSA